MFAHNLDERAAFAHLRDHLRAGGVALVEFRNALMSLFSMNRYSASFFWKDLLSGDRLPEPLREAARSFLSEKFDVQVDSVGKTRDIEYTDIIANFHNPMTLGDLLASYGLRLVKTHYYHFHAASPHLEKSHKAHFWSESLKLERTDDWRAMFLCSAFVAEIEK